VTPEVKEHFDKAHDCLRRGTVILAAGVAEDAARNAYLAAFHAAQALIFARTGRVAKTHGGVHSLFSRLAKEEHQLTELPSFLSKSYEFKSVADYEVGPHAGVSLEDAGAAIEAAQRFIDTIARLLD